MVFNKKEIKALSPNKIKRMGKRQILNSGSTQPNNVATVGTSMGMTVQMENASEISIKVIVRVRPHNEREVQDNSRTIIEVLDDKMLIFDPKEKQTPFHFHNKIQKGRDMLKKENKQLQFIFDRIFDSTSTNSDVFEESTKSLISNLLDGYNCSVFAYGATGAGKTHTMLGNKEDSGITYRTVAELFSEIEKQSKHREFHLDVTYLEIYNENVQDLLHKSGQLHLREDKNYGVIVAGLEPIAIQSASELLSLLVEGNKNRTQHPTDANKESSRSHAVFQVYIKIINKLDNQVQQVKLSMIDLAGSERASATGWKGVRFKEGASINKSLLALGNCINNLADGIKYVPYRDSKLTRLLKDSLGGNCHTVMITNIGPSSLTYEDTYNTLRYANRAKKIKSYAKKNVSCETHITGYIKIVEEQKKEIATLKSKLAVFESGVLQAALDNKPSKMTTELYCKLSKLYNEKKDLIEKILVLDSSDKIFACRMLYKKDADERLHNLTAAGDTLSLEEQNATGKSRINKSLRHFQQQRDSIRAQMKIKLQELNSIETKIQDTITSHLKVKTIDESLQNKLFLHNTEIEKCWFSEMQQHVKKLNNLLQNERQSVNTIIKRMSETLQNYYNIVKGYGMMTDKMQVESQELTKLLKGFRNISWSDSDMVSNAENFSIFSIVRIDLLNNTIPYIPTTSEIDDEKCDIRDTNILNSTYDTTSRGDNCIDNTLNLIDESNESNISNDKFIQGTPHEKIGAKGVLRKRVLSDKSHENGSTPAKQTKKLLINNKSIVHSNGRTSKENVNKYQKPTQMSAKSIAILNNLKTNINDVSTLLSINSNDNNKEGKDVTLKTVRNKERRGLTTTHPYHKPIIEKKPTPALPSNRIPW